MSDYSGELVVSLSVSVNPTQTGRGGEGRGGEGRGGEFYFY